MGKVVKDPPHPGSVPHVRTITASKVPAILGLDTYKTPEQLWMEMKGLSTPEPVDNTATRWGHDAEESLVRWWLRHHPGWKAGRGEVAYTDPELPYGNLVTLDRRARRGNARHIIECKTSRSTSLWTSETELPAKVYAQVLAQMAVSGIHSATVVAQVEHFGLYPIFYDVEFDAELWSQVSAQLAAFWESLGQDGPPELPDEVVDALAESRPVVQDRDVVDLDPADTAVRQIVELQSQIYELEDRLAQVKADFEAEHAGPVTVSGKAFMSRQKGRFSVKNLPVEARHLAEADECKTLKFDPAKFKEAHPDLYAHAVGAPSWRYTLKAAQ